MVTDYATDYQSTLTAKSEQLSNEHIHTVETTYTSPVYPSSSITTGSKTAQQNDSSATIDLVSTPNGGITGTGFGESTGSTNETTNSTLPFTVTSHLLNTRVSTSNQALTRATLSNTTVNPTSEKRSDPISMVSSVGYDDPTTHRSTREESTSEPGRRTTPGPDACSASPCGTGQCRIAPNGYVCICPDGSSGDTCTMGKCRKVMSCFV